MPLDDVQKKAFLEFVKTRTRLGACDVCGSNAWTFSDSIWELREFNGGSLKLGGPIYPVLAATCPNCGNTHLLNAIVAGVLQPESGVGVYHRILCRDRDTPVAVD